MATPVATTRMTFDDEFNTFSNSPDGSNAIWRTTLPYGGVAARTLPNNNEAEYYSDPSVGVNPFSVNNGVLSITAAPAAPGSNTQGLPYTSGVITTQNSFTQLYGYFEINAKLPAQQGMWPAFWMIDDPYSEELDIFEQVNAERTTIHTTVHGMTNGVWGGTGQGPTVPDTSAAFHTYGVDWQPKTANFYVDGVEVASIATPDSMNAPMFFIANLAVGGAGSWPGAPDATTTFPASMQINWIHAYATAYTQYVGGSAAIPVGGNPPPPPPPSANDTVVKAGSAAAITDSSGNQWTITATGQVAVNGAIDTTTASVIELAYVNGVVWQENSSSLWWSKTSPSAAWGPAAGTATSPVTPPPPPSPDNTVIKAGSAAAITDATGNKWTITASGQVAVNGAADTTTSGVVELAYEKGLIWQENTGSLWWSKTAPSDAWGPVAGTATSPVPVVITPSPNNTVVMAGSANAITDASGNKWTITAGGQVAVNGVADTTTSRVVELDYTKGLVWQQNADSFWWSKTAPTAAWGPAAGTATPPVSITVTNKATAAVTTIDATKVHNETDYGAAFSLTAPGIAKVTLGITAEKLTFANMSSISLTVGSAAATVLADGGKNAFAAGKGALDVTGGPGASAYYYHSGNALLTIEDFSAAKGATLTVETALKGSLVIASDGHGGTMLTFGSLGAGIDLKSVAAMQAASIHWG